MSSTEKVEVVDLLFDILSTDSDYFSMHGRHMLQKTTLDLTEQALQAALTNLVVNIVLGNS
jgi:hypothetical protein